MTRMVRKQIYITDEQEAGLKEKAKKRGTSEAELIREGIDDVLREPLRVPIDMTDWKKEQEYIEERRKLVVPQTGRTWTRDELYDDDKRFKRYSD